MDAVALRDSSEQFIAAFWPDYVELAIEEGPNFAMMAHLVDHAVREFNRVFQ
jgi:hypothetical protein